MREARRVRIRGHDTNYSSRVGNRGNELRAKGRRQSKRKQGNSRQKGSDLTACKGTG